MATSARLIPDAATGGAIGAVCDGGGTAASFGCASFMQNAPGGG
jgi:hypothetical protein